MALARIAGVGGSGLNGGTTGSINTTGANLLVAEVGWENGVTADITLSDSKSNTWTALTKTTLGSRSARIFYCLGGTVGSGHTFTVSGSTTYTAFAVTAFSGAKSSSVVDQECAGATNASTTSIQPGSVTPSENGCLVYTGLFVGGGTCGTPGLNGGFSAEGALAADGINNGGTVGGYLIQIGAAAANPTISWTTARIGVAVGAVFKSDGTPPASLTATDQTANRIFQRAAGTSAKSITFAGTYTGSAPATIEIKIVNASGGATVQDWTALSSATIAGGNWSGTLSVPQGGVWYNFLARSKDSGGAVLETAAQSSNSWGVGIVFATIGSSNMRYWFAQSSSPPVTSTLTKMYSGSWAAVGGNGAIRFANLVQTGTGLLVGMMNYGVDGSAIYTNTLNSAGVWTDLTAGEPYPLFETGLTAVGDCEMVLLKCTGVDADCGTSTANYKAGLDTIYGRIRTATGRSAAQLPFLLMPGQTTNANSDGATDARWAAIMDASIQWAEETTGGYIGGSMIDLPRVDVYHYAAATYERIARRFAQTVLFILGLETYPGSGLSVGAATYAGAVVTVQISQTGGGTALETGDGGTSGTGLIGWEVFDNGTPATISSTAFSGNNVVLTCSASLSGPVTVRCLYGMNPSGVALNADNEGFVVDNTTPQGDTLGLPLLSSDGSFTATAAGGARLTGGYYGGGGGRAPVRTQGKGRKRRYFIELDGRRLYGSRVELEGLLERRERTPPPAIPAVVRKAPEPAPMAALAPIPEPDIRPVDLSGIEAARDRLRRQYEDAAIALLLLN